FRRAALAWGIATAILLALSALAGDLARARPLLGSIAVLSLVLVIWLVSGPVASHLAAATNSRHIRSEETSMTEPNTAQRKHRGPRWGVYVAAIVAVNSARRAVIPFGTVPVWADALIALAIAALLFVAITAVHRTTHQH